MPPFDKEFFKKYQGILIKIVKVFSGLFNIGDGWEVISIGPSFVKYFENGENKIRLYSFDFFSLTFFRNFTVFFRLFHCWDMLVANNIDERLNLGFDTLNSFSDNTVGSLVSGSIIYSDINGQPWASLRAVSSGTLSLGGLTVSTRNDGNSNEYDTFGRGFLNFDISALWETSNGDIVDDINISYCNIDLYDISKNNDLSGLDDDLGGVYLVGMDSDQIPGGLVANDMSISRYDTTAYLAKRSHSGLSLNAYNSFTFGVYDNIKAFRKYGLFRVLVTSGYDYSNTAVPWEGTSMGFSHSFRGNDNANYPYMDVTYTQLFPLLMTGIIG